MRDVGFRRAPCAARPTRQVNAGQARPGPNTREKVLYLRIVPYLRYLTVPYLPTCYLTSRYRYLPTLGFLNARASKVASKVRVYVSRHVPHGQQCHWSPSDLNPMQQGQRVPRSQPHSIGPRAPLSKHQAARRPPRLECMHDCMAQPTCRHECGAARHIMAIHRGRRVQTTSSRSRELRALAGCCACEWLQPASWRANAPHGAGESHMVT